MRIAYLSREHCLLTTQPIDTTVLEKLGIKFSSTVKFGEEFDHLDITCVDGGLVINEIVYEVAKNVGKFVWPNAPVLTRNLDLRLYSCGYVRSIASISTTSSPAYGRNMEDIESVAWGVVTDHYKICLYIDLGRNMIRVTDIRATTGDGYPVTVYAKGSNICTLLSNGELIFGRCRNKRNDWRHLFWDGDLVSMGTWVDMQKCHSMGFTETQFYTIVGDVLSIFVRYQCNIYPAYILGGVISFSGAPKMRFVR